MNSTLGYLARMYRALKNDYTTPNGGYSESCTEVAVDLARRLLTEGKKPQIERISEKSRKAVITPRRFQGRVTWGGHIICTEGDRIYDPLVSDLPVDRENYSRTAFSEEVEIEVAVPSEKILEFISRSPA